MEDIERYKSRIRELEKREHELTLRVTELRDFIENASMPLHWVNGSGVVVWANQAEMDLLGYPREEYLNQHISKFHADKHVIEDILSRLVNKETLLNYPARLVCRNGAIKHVLINSNAYWKGEQFVHTRCFTRDITALKAEDEKKSELISQLYERYSRLQKDYEALQRKHSSATV
jgi:PAS domain S-box-containing protein